MWFLYRDGIIPQHDLIYLLRRNLEWGYSTVAIPQASRHDTAAASGGEEEIEAVASASSVTHPRCTLKTLWWVRTVGVLPATISYQNVRKYNKPMIVNIITQKILYLRTCE